MTPETGAEIEFVTFGLAQLAAHGWRGFSEMEKPRVAEFLTFFQKNFFLSIFGGPVGAFVYFFIFIQKMLETLVQSPVGAGLRPSTAPGNC